MPVPSQCGFLVTISITYGNNTVRGRKLSQHVYTLTQTYLHRHDRKNHNCICQYLHLNDDRWCGMYIC